MDEGFYSTSMMEGRESVIDFACSSGYASYYASLGLTPDFPPEFYHNLPESLGDKLERELDEREAKAKFRGPYPKMRLVQQKPHPAKLTKLTAKQPRKGFSA